MSDGPNDRTAASVRQLLLNLAQTRNEDYNFVLTRYASERFLYRLSRSAHRAELILKGAMLFQLWSESPHRATKDLDLLASGDVSKEAIASKLLAICAIDVEMDGLLFDTSALIVSDISEDDRYVGVRAKFVAKLGSAKIAMQIDFGVGDAVTPAPMETKYPTLLEMPHPVIFAYPRETVVAEKLEAIVDLGMDNSRMKDYFDLWFIATTYPDDSETLALAVQRTFARRQQDLPQEVPIGLSNEFARDPAKQLQWEAFLARAIGASLSLADAVSEVRVFAMPVFAMASTSLGFGGES